MELLSYLFPPVYYSIFEGFVQYVYFIAYFPLFLVLLSKNTTGLIL